MWNPEIISNRAYNSITTQHLNFIFISEIIFYHIYHLSKFRYNILNFDLVVVVYRIKSVTGIRDKNF